MKSIFALSIPAFAQGFFVSSLILGMGSVPAAPAYGQTSGCVERFTALREWAELYDRARATSRDQSPASPREYCAWVPGASESLMRLADRVQQGPVAPIDPRWPIWAHKQKSKEIACTASYACVYVDRGSQLFKSFLLEIRNQIAEFIGPEQEDDLSRRCGYPRSELTGVFDSLRAMRETVDELEAFSDAVGPTPDPGHPVPGAPDFTWACNFPQ